MAKLPVEKSRIRRWGLQRNRRCSFIYKDTRPGAADLSAMLSVQRPRGPQRILLFSLQAQVNQRQARPWHLKGFAS